MKSLRVHAVGSVCALTIAAALWLFPTPSAVPSTYAAALALFVGIGAIISMTWQNARPTETIGQVLQRTEADGAGIYEGRKQ